MLLGLHAASRTLQRDAPRTPRLPAAEGRRLAHVAATRARKGHFISWPRNWVGSANIWHNDEVGGVAQDCSAGHWAALTAQRLLPSPRHHQIPALNFHPTGLAGPASLRPHRTVPLPML